MNGEQTLGAQVAFTQISYLVAAALFVLSLKWLSAPESARRGVWAGEIGMGLAILGTLLLPETLAGLPARPAIGCPYDD